MKKREIKISAVKVRLFLDFASGLYKAWLRHLTIDSILSFFKDL